MSDTPFPVLDGFSLGAARDLPDARDLIYDPPPIELRSVMPRPRSVQILDQGATEAACTGFALAAVINLLNQRRHIRTRVSPRMLYEMARKYDEWPGEAYEGSSCRGAIKGFANMGVCRESYWPWREGRPGTLTLRAARDARNNTIGAYYRLRPRISDFHAALNQAGAILCSARIHPGWSGKRLRGEEIVPAGDPLGAHAFAIVGYTRKGFWVQNSWGRSWGRGGLALWRYEDWFEHLLDAWVISLGLPTPQLWKAKRPPAHAATIDTRVSRKPPRARIAGHFVHLDDGRFHDAGTYWSNLDDVRLTATHLAASRKYEHLLIYAHGGLNSPRDSARRIAALRDVFRANGIYPYHVMYDTGLAEEVKDLILRRRKQLETRAGGIVDWWDRLLERLLRKPGRAIWREIKQGARSGFEDGMDGTRTLEAFAQAFAEAGSAPRIHLAGHSTGGILLAHLLEALQEVMPALRIASCSLMAPAATIDLYRSHYRPLLADPASAFGIDRMTVYNLSERLEREDSVAGIYRKSLLYLVSRSFEERTPAPLLGMARHTAPVEDDPNIEFVISRGDARIEPRCAASTHGGFDNDPATMNDLLRNVLGHEPKRPFTKADLDY